MSRGSSIPWKMLTPNEQNCAKNTPPLAPGPLERGIPREEVLRTSPEGDELLTVNVLDETGGARHIVHFELS